MYLVSLVGKNEPTHHGFDLFIHSEAGLVILNFEGWMRFLFYIVSYFVCFEKSYISRDIEDENSFRCNLIQPCEFLLPLLKIDLHK